MILDYEVLVSNIVIPTFVMEEIRRSPQVWKDMGINLPHELVTHHKISFTHQLFNLFNLSSLSRNRTIDDPIVGLFGQ